MGIQTIVLRTALKIANHGAAGVSVDFCVGIDVGVGGDITVTRRTKYSS